MAPYFKKLLTYGVICGIIYAEQKNTAEHEGGSPHAPAQVSKHLHNGLRPHRMDKYTLFLPVGQGELSGARMDFTPTV